jgi:hypothetical protein
MRLPWYKSKAATISALVLSLLLGLKAYASYMSTQEQKQTETRIQSLHSLDPLHAKYAASIDKETLVSFKKALTHADDPIEQQARQMLANKDISPQQKKLAQRYLEKRKDHPKNALSDTTD